jgi:TatD DNase family protein
MLVDSHCHLNMCQDVPGIISRAKASGVQYMQTICTDLDQIPDLIKITEEYEGVFASVGVHPCSVKNTADVPGVDRLIQIAKHEKIIGLGETGLDYYHPGYNKQEQNRSFINHINVSQETGLPVIVHTRSADEDTAQFLTSEYKNKAFKGLIHCFASDIALAKKVLDINCYISISGIVTFKNADLIHEVVKYTPLDMLLIETDSPYLAPTPNRGKTNEPSFVTFVAKKIADIKEISLEKVAEQTTNNFFSLFNKASR